MKNLKYLGALWFIVSALFKPPYAEAGLILNYVTGSTQCLQADSAGAVTGAGAGCGPAGVSGDLQTNSTGSFGALTPGAGFATWVATPNSANLRALLTDETGTGAAVFATSPVLVTPNLGVPSAVDLTNATNSPRSLTIRWAAAVDPNNAVIFTADAATTVLSIRGTVGDGVGSAATVQVNKAADGAACSAGTNQASATFNANGTANTNQTLTLAGGGANTLSAGDRLCLITTGGANWTGGSGNGGLTIKVRVL